MTRGLRFNLIVNTTWLYPIFYTTAAMVTGFRRTRPVSRPSSELVYLVLDAVINAQAEGRKIGAPVDPNNPRIVILQDPNESCWSAT